MQIGARGTDEGEEAFFIKLISEFKEKVGEERLLELSDQYGVDVLRLDSVLKQSSATREPTFELPSYIWHQSFSNGDGTYRVGLFDSHTHSRVSLYGKEIECALHYLLRHKMFPMATALVNASDINVASVYRCLRTIRNVASYFDVTFHDARNWLISAGVQMHPDALHMFDGGATAEKLVTLENRLTSDAASYSASMTGWRVQLGGKEAEK